MSPVMYASPFGPEVVMYAAPCPTTTPDPTLPFVPPGTPRPEPTKESLERFIADMQPVRPPLGRWAIARAVQALIYELGDAELLPAEETVIEEAILELEAWLG